MSKFLAVGGMGGPRGRHMCPIEVVLVPMVESSRPMWCSLEIWEAASGIVGGQGDIWACICVREPALAEHCGTCCCPSEFCGAMCEIWDSASGIVGGQGDIWACICVREPALSEHGDNVLRPKWILLTIV